MRASSVNPVDTAIRSGMLRFFIRLRMGGASATRSVEEGAASIVSVAALKDGPTVGFFRDGSPIPW